MFGALAAFVISTLSTARWACVLHLQYLSVLPAHSLTVHSLPSSSTSSHTFHPQICSFPVSPPDNRSERLGRHLSFQIQRLSTVLVFLLSAKRRYSQLWLRCCCVKDINRSFYITVIISFGWVRATVGFWFDDNAFLSGFKSVSSVLIKKKVQKSGVVHHFAACVYYS